MKNVNWKIYIFLIFPLILFARINPFEPVITPQNTIVVKPKYFTKKRIYPPKNARILKKIIFIYQTLSGDEKKQIIDINKNVDFHSPIVIVHKPVKFSMREIDFPNFKMFVKDKKILIQTKDKLLRAFFLADPFRLVMDFKKQTNFLTIKKTLKNSYIKKVVVGSHSGFYRIVIYFDAKYSYKIKKSSEGIIVELR